VSIPFPEPTAPVPSRAEVFLGYLGYFRSRVVTKLEGLPSSELRSSRLPSGWTPVELLKHLTYVEMRWLEWGFEGRDVPDPWGDAGMAAGMSLPGRPWPALSRPWRPRRRGPGPSWAPTLWTTSVPPVRGGTGLPRRRWSGSCSTCCRSTRGTWASSTSPVSWPTARPVNKRGGQVLAP
jgi:Protein of unknown function (DUF664)